ncbi:hypothetical protein EGW08_011926, partial [Elysia chlorotica]
VCEGDAIEVKVYNELLNSEGTSVHWHGLLQKGTPHMDGISLITQCPITTRSSFTYRFKALDPGTHYWHAHSGMQRADGMYGAIVVRQPASRDPHFALYDHDLSDHVIIVTDWTPRMTLPDFLDHHHDDAKPFPPQILINGMGAYAEFKSGSNTIFTPRASFTVEGGKRYRFRVISNALSMCPMQISVDGHNLTVIASDGSPFQPVEVDSFDILNGERYDFVLHANQTAELKNFWIRVRGQIMCRFTKAHQVALLRYAGAPDVDPPEPTDWGGVLLNPWNSAASDNEIDITRMRTVVPDADDSDLTSEPDKQFYFGMDYYQVDSYVVNHPEYYPLYVVDSTKRSYPTQMNRISSRLPASPPLSQYKDTSQSEYCNEFTVQKDCARDWCSCIHKVNVSLGELVELVFVDEGVLREANHPIHLHGFKFRVVAMGKLNTSTSVAQVKALDKLGKINRTRSGAPHKDSVTVPDGGYTVLRFRADNPGMWFVHCHITAHTTNGMDIIIQVGHPSEFPKTPKNFPRCGSWNDDFEDENDDENNNQPILFQCLTPGDNYGNRARTLPGYILVAVGVISIMLGLPSITLLGE